MRTVARNCGQSAALCRRRTQKYVRQMIFLTRSWSLCPVSAGCPQLDVESGDAKRLDLLGDVLGGQHSGVRRRLIAVGLHLHATSHAAKSLTETDSVCSGRVSKESWSSVVQTFSESAHRDLATYSTQVCRAAFNLISSLAFGFGTALKRSIN
jgi:hypothetical protein